MVTVNQQQPEATMTITAPEEQQGREPDLPGVVAKADGVRSLGQNRGCLSPFRLLLTNAITWVT